MRIVAEGHELGAGTLAARAHVLDAARALVGAVIRGAVRDMRAEIASSVRRDDVLTLDTPYHHRVAASLGTAGDVFTATDAEVVPRREWRASAWVNERVRPSRLDHFLGSHLVLEGGAVEGMGFMRAAGDRPFGAEDRELLHLVHLGIGRLFAAPTPRDTLSPRARDTLDQLLSGASEKEAAARLRISPHTVHDYVKQIYRAYRVASRAELLALPRR